MQKYYKLSTIAGLMLAMVFSIQALLSAQDHLPPIQPWQGKSEQLIVEKDNPWITPAEKNDFNLTPTLLETTNWLKKLSLESPYIHFGIAGRSAMARPIPFVVASKEKLNDAESLDYLFRQSFEKPNILIQGGIHAGEIDGKDAGLMLLRDIALNGKEELLDKVNIVFVPILSVDGHENASEFNRPNQRGPQNMGWRTNARNLNLNRDYTKLETEGIQAIVGLMNKYDPVFYIDIHVTDGADYQYDITYGYRKKNGYSPAISAWMINHYQEKIDEGLRDMGHIPGPLIFTYKTDDFLNGIIDYALPLRFSDAYGDARHIPSVLVENHSLKPYKQRVLGTYVYLEETIKIISAKLEDLLKSIQTDRKTRRDTFPLNYGPSKIQNDSIELLIIDHQKIKSLITNKEYTKWTGTPVTKKIPIFQMNQPMNKVKVPKAYWIPKAWKEVILKLKKHGVFMEDIGFNTSKELTYNYISSYEINPIPSEGRFRFKNFKLEAVKRKSDPKSAYVRIPYDQDLGSLAILLLEPQASDSFFQWGYFNEVLSRTEYIESYVMEPLILKMIKEDPSLEKEFNAKKEMDAKFGENPEAIFKWFYSKTPYFDKNWKIIPVGMEY